MSITGVGLAGPKTYRQVFSNKSETSLPAIQITRIGLAGARTFNGPYSDKSNSDLADNEGSWNYPALRKRKVR